MRRWNGWGDDTVHYPVTETAAGFLKERLGPGTKPADAELADVLAAMPESRLPHKPSICLDPLKRLQHARGQSLPDWIALRSGQIESYPDGVAFPQSEAEISALIRFAAQVGANLVPYGGGTSVVGHVTPLIGDVPTITASMRHLNRLQALNEQDLLATIDAGASGPEVEAQLRAHNLTLGHYPQSFEFSTLGGWIATRSAGQQALLYGRIEDLFAGGTLVSPTGKLVLQPHPASAAGPDLRQLVLGSEGRLGFITQAMMRVSHLPEVEEFHGLFFPDFACGLSAVREVVQAKVPVSLLRLSTSAETETTLALAGHERLVTIMGTYLKMRGIGRERALLVAGFSGSKRIADASRSEVMAIAARHGAVSIGQRIGKQWRESRFRTPYLRNTLWDLGYAIDTLETAVPWHRVKETMAAIQSALAGALAPDSERVFHFAHVSHLYSSGASVYVTYLFRVAPDPRETLSRWKRLKAAASEAIVAKRGTISHQHGVGQDHKCYLPLEKGPLGMEMIVDVTRRADPRGVMNPGKLVDSA